MSIRGHSLKFLYKWWGWGDGNTVISGSADNSARLFFFHLLCLLIYIYLLTFALFRVWDIKSGKTLVVYKEHTYWVNCVGLAPLCNSAITGSDKEVRYGVHAPPDIWTV